jgi:hypothetical protein
MGLLLRHPQCLGLGFEPRGPRAELGDARLELGLLDQTFGVAVDDAVDRTAGLDDLTLEDVEL